MKTANKLLIILTLLALTFSNLGVMSAMAATLTVTSNADSGAGSLRQAIADAAAGDTITFDSALSGQTIILASTLTLDKNITLDGSSLALPVTISGNNTVRVLYVNSGITATLNSLTVSNGYVYNQDGSGIYNNGDLTVIDSTFSGNNTVWGSGGGIYSKGVLTVHNSTFSDNLTWLAGGGILNSGGTATITNSTFSGNDARFGGNSVTTFGGGLCNDGGGIVTITGSTFSGNSASDAFGGNYFGGGVHNDSGTVSVTNSTFTANSAANGGGLSNYGTMTITNSTFSGNSATVTGSEIHNDSNPWQIGTVTVTNTIVSNSASGGNCGGTPIINGGNNLDDGMTCGFGSTNDSLSSINPQLGTLTGSPAYFPLAAGSPAIDSVTYNAPNGCPITDQRGVKRPQGTHCDIGAYEAMFLPSPWIGGISVTSDKNIVAVGRPHIGSEIASYDGFSAGSLTAYVPMLFKNAYGGSYDSALYIQNVDSALATLSIKYYDSTGTLTCTVSGETIAPLASKGYWLPGLAASCLPDGWVGGAVVTSDKNIVANGRPHIGAEVMTYDSFSAGSLASYLPMLFKNAYGGSYDAAFYVQNVDTTNTANLTIKYYDSAGALTCTVTGEMVAPLASKGYWLPGLAASCLPDNWVGGVKVESTTPIVTVGRPHIGTQVTTYNGFAAGATSSYVPMLFKNAFGGSYDAAFYVQNVGATTATLSIKYYDLAGNLTCTVPDSVAPLASKGYWLPGLPATCLPDDWVGGAVVTSDVDVVAIGRPHIGAQVTTYNGFTSGSLSSSLPMLFKDAYGGSYDSAYYIQNTEASAANVITKFYDNTGALTCTRNDTLAPFSTLSLWLPSLSCVP